MIKEIHSAISFLSTILRPVLSNCSTVQIDAFQESLIDLLCSKFATHWDVSNPIKGNAFRSLMVSCSYVDPILQEAARRCSFEISMFPTELTIWIDPGEVTYRFGENGSIANLDILSQNEKNFITAK
ncbi:Protein btg1 [Mitosporidium daphniae]